MGDNSPQGCLAGKSTTRFVRRQPYQHDAVGASRNDFQTLRFAKTRSTEPLPCEDLFQFVSRITAKPPGSGAQKIEIHRLLCGLIGRSRVRHILGTACEAFHGDEIFPANDA